MKQRMLSILVVLALIFGLFGCQKAPVETQPPTQETTQPTETTVPEPTAPDALTAYGDARAALESEGGICLDITVHKDMTLEDEVFYTRSEQVLTYATGEDGKLLICMEEKFDNGEPEEEPEEAAAEEEPLPPASQSVLSAAVPTPAPAEAKPVYKATTLKNTEVAAEDFLMLRHRAGIKKKVEAVIAQEAPISKALLTRRVVQSYGIGRAGSRIQGYMDKIYDSMGLLTTTMDDQIFYWAPEQDPTAYDIYRVAENEDDRRDAKDLPVQEAVNAVYQALADQLSLNNEDLIRESAKLMGYSRLGSAVSAAFAAAIAYAQAQGKITTSPNGNWILV